MGAGPQGRHVGISYGGISQLFTAQTRPPDLEAIAPCRCSMRPARRCTPAASSTPVSRSRGLKNASRTPNRPLPAMARHGPTNGSSQVTPPARPTRPCTARRPTCCPRSGKTPPTTRRWPIRWTRSASCTTSTCRRSWPASGRTSRPVATAPTWPSTSPAPDGSGSRSPTGPISTRSTRTRTTACTTSWSCSSPTVRRSSNRPCRVSWRRSSISKRWGSRSGTW